VKEKEQQLETLIFYHRIGRSTTVTLLHGTLSTIGSNYWKITSSKVRKVASQFTALPALEGNSAPWMQLSVQSLFVFSLDLTCTSNWWVWCWYQNCTEL